MPALDPSLVTAAPSGQYGFYVPSHRRAGTHGPVVQITQFVKGTGWCGTPAQHYATSVVSSQGQCWPIDAGQDWGLNEDDTAAFREYAALMLALSEAVSL